MILNVDMKKSIKNLQLKMVITYREYFLRSCLSNYLG